MTLKSFGFYGCFITSHQNCNSGPSTYDTDQGFSPVKPLSQPHDFIVLTAPITKRSRGQAVSHSKLFLRCLLGHCYAPGS